MANITLRTKKDGSKSYKVVIRKAGQATITKTFSKRREATAWATQTEAAIDSGDLSIQSTKTLGDCIDSFVRYRNEDRDTRLAAGQKVQAPLGKYELKVLDWWRQQLGNRRAALLTGKDFRACRRKLEAEPIKVGTVNRRMSLISACLTHAVETDIIKSNPARMRALSEKETERTRLMSAAEWEAVQAACAASDEPCLLDFMLVAVGTAARAGELQALRWSDVDLNVGVAVLQRTKNGDRRVIPIRGRALEILSRRKASRPADLGHDFVFWNSTGHAPFYYCKAWHAARAASGVADLRFHDLRHHAASHLAMAGASTRELAEVLGHRQLQMVQRYSHFHQEHIARLGDVLDSALRDIG